MGYFRFFVRAFFTIVILIGCIYLVDIDELGSALTMAQPRYLFMTILITVLGTIIVPALLTWNALHVERLTLSLGRLVMINFAMRFYMLVLPRPVSLGMRWMRYKKGGTGYDALALMVFERIVQMLVYSFSATLLLGLSMQSLPDYGGYIWLMAAFTFLVTLLGIAPFFSSLANRLLGWFVARSEQIMPRFIYRGLVKLLDAVAVFHKLPAMRVLFVVTCSMAGYVLLVLMQTMNFSIPLLGLAWIRSTVFLIAQIPLTVGGIGLREAGFIGLLGMYGVSEYDALAFSLLFLCMHILIGLFGVTYDVFRWLFNGSDKFVSE
jgi:uncharacterized membrane protein YbhN (UPF0104 family)